MNKVEKTEILESLKTKFAKANAAFITEYRGMPVEKLHQLRNKVRGGKGELYVIKNRIARIAAKGTSLESLAEQFKGPIALALCYGDPCSVAKAISGEVADESSFKINSGSLSGKIITDKQVVALSKLPDQKTQLAMLLSAVQGPLRNFAGVISAVPRDFVNVLTALKAQKAKQ